MCKLRQVTFGEPRSDCKYQKVKAMQRPLAVVDGTGAAVLYVRILGKPAVCV